MTISVSKLNHITSGLTEFTSTLSLPLSVPSFKFFQPFESDAMRSYLLPCSNRWRGFFHDCPHSTPWYLDYQKELSSFLAKHCASKDYRSNSSSTLTANRAHSTRKLVSIFFHLSTIFFWTFHSTASTMLWYVFIFCTSADKVNSDFAAFSFIRCTRVVIPYKSARRLARTTRTDHNYSVRDRTFSVNVRLENPTHR